MAFRGIDIRQSGDRVVFRASLKDSAGAKLTTGTTTLRLFELQSDGSLKSYDFADNTFKTTALTTATASMAHRTGNNGTYSTGLWTYSLTTVSGFVRGNVYLSQVSNTGASPADQERQFQYGEGEGDATVTTAGAVPVATIANDAITAAALAADAVQKIVTGVYEEPRSNHIDGDTFGGMWNQTADNANGIVTYTSTIVGIVSGLASDTATAVWAAATRTLTSLSGLSVNVADKTGFSLTSAQETSIIAGVWNYSARSLTTFGTLVADVATAVWAAVSRTLTSGGAGAVYGQDGSILFTYVVYAVNGTTPLPGIEVWVSSDTAGLNRSPATKITDALGRVTFNLDPGVVYVWRRDPRQDIPGSAYYPFSTYDTETVSA